MPKCKSALKFTIFNRTHFLNIQNLYNLQLHLHLDQYNSTKEYDITIFKIQVLSHSLKDLNVQWM